MPYSRMFVRKRIVNCHVLEVRLYMTLEKGLYLFEVEV